MVAAVRLIFCEDFFHIVKCFPSVQHMCFGVLSKLCEYKFQCLRCSNHCQVTEKPQKNVWILKVKIRCSNSYNAAPFFSCSESERAVESI